MNNDRAQGTSRPANAKVVDVWRPKSGETGQVLMLSPAYTGMITHWVKNRSEHCQQADCNPVWHKTKAYWKGYTAILGWASKPKLWIPFVLEITEHLELDLRDVYKRGQVWEISRPAVAGDKKYPVVGRLLEERSPRDVPPAFNVLPVLQHLYHPTVLHLGIANPLPPRIVVDSFAAPGPVAQDLRNSQASAQGVAEERPRLGRLSRPKNDRNGQSGQQPPNRTA